MISLYANDMQMHEITLISIGVVIRDHAAGNADSLWYRLPMKFDILD